MSVDDIGRPSETPDDDLTEDNDRASEKPDDGDMPAPAFPPPITDEIDLPSTARLRAVRPKGQWKRWVLMLIVVSACVGPDQISKQWAHTTLRQDHAGRLKVIDGYFSLTYVRNPGAAWGFLARRSATFRRPFFIGVSIVAVTFILYLFVKLESGQRLLMLALSMVMGGALGNFIDRVRFNYVIDFLDVHYGRSFKWPTFNVADMAITIGVFLMLCEMIVASIRQNRERRRQAEPPAEPPAESIE